MIIVTDSGGRSSAYNKEYTNKYFHTSHVVAKATQYLHLESFNGGAERTKFTCTGQVDLGGIIPQYFVDRGAVSFMSDFNVMRELFGRDYEIDLSSRRAILDRMEELEDTYHMGEERDTVKRAKDRFRAFDNAEGEMVKMETNHEFITATGSMVEGKVWCKLSTTLRCGGEDALDIFLDVTSLSLSGHDKGGCGKFVLEEEVHSRTVKIAEEMTGILGARFNKKIARKLVWESKTSFTTKRNGEIGEGKMGRQRWKPKKKEESGRLESS